jgi:hypothetical protein
MKNIIETALIIYIVGSPIFTTIFILLGLIQLNYNPKAEYRKFNIVTTLIVILYFGWWHLLKSLIIGNEN